MNNKIFVNYRRDDADAWADRLCDRLKEYFHKENVFLDVDGGIPIGVRWEDWIKQEVSKCNIMLALIGRNWFSELERRQSSDRRDTVRFEIEQALEQRLPVVPVLLGDAEMPLPEQLPETIRSIFDYQAARLDRSRFQEDVEKLIAGIEGSIAYLPVRATLPEELTPSIFLEPESGVPFYDHLANGSDGPAMVVIPAGSFIMGSPEEEPGRWDREGPQRTVFIKAPFAIGKYAVTFEDYDRYAYAVGVQAPSDRGWGRGRRPVISVSYKDAEGYCRWLSEQTGADYRLPSEAEWQYACRAGSTTPFWWGEIITPDQANYDCREIYEGGGQKGSFLNKTEVVEAFSPNPWGLYQVHGNVWEWCSDAWNDNYKQAPDDSSSWMTGNISRAVVCGGSWNRPPKSLRSASRIWLDRNKTSLYAGFRIVRDLSR